jgi:hypothetical protein
MQKRIYFFFAFFLGFFPEPQPQQPHDIISTFFAQSPFFEDA